MSNRNYVDGFYEIPIVKLKHHYFINNECTIIHIKNKKSPVMEHYSPKSAKISVDQVKNIWEHLQNGESIRSVSELFGISYGIVKKIRGRVRWTKVTNQLGPLPNENTKIMHNISVQRLSKGCIESE